MSQLYRTIFGSRLYQEFKLKDAILLLESKDLIDVGELAELAISKKSKIIRCSKNHPDIDLVSGKQIKHARTNPENPTYEGKNLVAYITTRNHKSTILTIVTERLTNKEYYFVFPYSSYSHVNANTIGIPFYSDGKPYLKNKWWQYQVESFEQLCEMAK